MQLGLARLTGGASAAPDLPTGPFISRHVLEEPALVASVLIALGIILFLALNQRSQARRGLAVGSGLVLAGVGIVVLARAIETPRETISRLSSAVIVAAIDANRAGLDPLLAPNIRVGTLDHDAASLDREALLRLVGSMSRLEVREWSARRIGLSMDGPGGGRADFSVRVDATGAGMAGSMISSWRFTWRRTSTGPWQLVELTWLTMHGRPVRGDMLTEARRLSN